VGLRDCGIVVIGLRVQSCLGMEWSLRDRRSWANKQKLSKNAHDDLRSLR
jgi:hypothetical protein